MKECNSTNAQIFQFTKFSILFAHNVHTWVSLYVAYI